METKRQEKEEEEGRRKRGKSIEKREEWMDGRYWRHCVVIDRKCDVHDVGWMGEVDGGNGNEVGFRELRK